MGEADQYAAIDAAGIPSLRILKYPSPALRETGRPVDPADESLGALVEKMFELMFSASGVGLSATQVGVSACMFVCSPSCQADDRLVCLNPEIVSVAGSQTEEEGCLSLPGITCNIKRAETVVLAAVDMAGQRFEITGQGLTARLFQHELDHLNGKLLVDRMGSVAKLANRRALQDLEHQFADG